MVPRGSLASSLVPDMVSSPVPLASSASVLKVIRKGTCRAKNKMQHIHIFLRYPFLLATLLLQTLPMKLLRPHCRKNTETPEMWHWVKNIGHRQLALKKTYCKLMLPLLPELQCWKTCHRSLYPWMTLYQLWLLQEKPWLRESEISQSRRFEICSLTSQTIFL